MIKVKVITSVPDAFPGSLGCSVLKRALDNKLWSLEIISLYDFGLGKHSSIDDRPFGGGAGMIIRADVVSQAVEFAIKGESCYSILCTSTCGHLFSQQMVQSFILSNALIIVCGRFGGIDQRVIDFYNMREVCIGNFVMSGGEIAAMAIIDACIRQIDGVLGNESSILGESFSSEFSGVSFHQYTKPRVWNNLRVPDELLSGNHAKIAKWKKDNSIKNTITHRSDLMRFKD